MLISTSVCTRPNFLAHRYCYFSELICMLGSLGSIHFYVCSKDFINICYIAPAIRHPYD